jgi:glycosyltransferase involved in cell wall biosynthesis/predicted Zn-dependent protease
VGDELNLPVVRPLAADAEQGPRLANLKVYPDSPETAPTDKRGEGPLVAVVFSKDRAMQLEAMLLSFRRHCRDTDLARVHVLYTTSGDRYEDQYRQLQSTFESVTFVRETDFKKDLLALVTDSRYVFFLVDDNLFVSDFSLADVRHHLDHQPRALAFSLRLGRNITYHYMSDRPQTAPSFTALGPDVLIYDWRSSTRYFGYPLDLSSSVYRTEDLQPLLIALVYTNPNTLEAALDFSKAHYQCERPRLLCYACSVAFCNPINIVQNTYKNRGGKKELFSVSHLARQFDAGKRIDIAPFSGFRPHAAHQEVDYDFKKSDRGAAGTATGAMAVAPPRVDFSVSIVIVTYNRSQWLAEALQSALDQRRPATEILVIDDGSSDDTEAVVHSFTDSRIRYLKMENNQGRPRARNTGVRKAVGEYILWLDDDDLLSTDTLQNYTAALYENPQLNLIYGKLQYFDGNSGADRRLFDPPDWSHQPTRLLNGLLWGCVIPNPGTMVKKSLYTQAGDYDQLFLRAQDYEFWTRAARFAIPKKVDAVVCRYRVHDCNISHGGHIDTSYESIIMRRLLQRHRLKDLFPELNWRVPVAARAAAYRALAAKLYEYNDYFNARNYLKKIPAGELSPEDVARRIDCNLYMGDFDHAQSELQHLAAIAHLKPSVARVISEHIKAYIRDVNAVKADFDVQPRDAWIRRLKELITRHDTTFDNVMLMAQWFETTDHPAYSHRFYKTAVHCNPEDEGAIRAALRVACTDDEKRELLAVRDRILFKETFFDDPRKDAPGDTASRLDDPVFQSMRMETEGQFQVEAIIEESRRWHHAEKTDHAVDLLMAGIKSAPDQVRLYYILAEILCDNHQYHAALGVLEQVPSENDEWHSLELAAFCHVALGQYQEAETLIARLLAVQSASAPVLNLQGQIAFQQGELAVAQACFKQALVTAPDDSRSYYNLGALKWAAAQQEESLALLEKGFLLDPTADDIRHAYYTAVKALGVTETILKAVEKAASAHPRHKKLQYMRIEFLLDMGHQETAMSAIESVMAAFGVDEGLIAAAIAVREKIGPLQIHSEADRQVTVSLCMIVKNETEHLARCLKSVKPVVDEIIVVDTGSTDHTPGIAKAFGAKVFSIEWQRDFAAARNHAIGRASGAFILIVDADEMLSCQDYEAFKNVIREAASSTAAYSIVTRNYTHLMNPIGWVPNDGRYAHEEAGSGWCPSQKVRLFPNDPRFRFEFPVHEIVGPSLQRAGLPIRTCTIPIHHYGKLDTQQNRKKNEAYFNIGLKKLNELQDDTTALYELAVQAVELERYREARDLWQHYIQLDPGTPIAFISLGTVYEKLGNYRQALAAAKQAVKLDPELKEAHHNCALAELFTGDAPAAINRLEQLLKRVPAYAAAQFKLAAAYCCDRRQKQWRHRIDALRRMPLGDGLPVACRELADNLLAAGQQDYARRLLEATLAQITDDDELRSRLDGCR